MAKETSAPEVVSRQLIELSLTKPPIHSFNRQLVRIVIDTVGALAATLWLLRETELLLVEEIEESVGAVRGIRISEQRQQQALRAAFEKGEVVVLGDVAEAFDPLGPAPVEQRTLVFIPVVGLRGNLGVLRLVFPPVSDAILSKQIQLAETLSGYYSLYSAQRILTVQHEERQDIDRLSKAILELQHYTFSRQLPEVVVNSALEITELDRVVLLMTDNTGELSVRAVSSVAQIDRKGAWARLVCELGQIVLQTGLPLHFLAGVTNIEDIEDEELRRQVNSYVLMTGAKSLLLYPQSSAGEKVAVLIFESFADRSLTTFERVLCTVFAAHTGSALGNHRLFQSVPFSKFFAKRLDLEREAVKRGRSRLGKVLKWGAGALAVAGAIWFMCFRQVVEKVGAPCFVVPETERVLTAPIAGEIQSVRFQQGDRVEQSDLLVKFRTDQLELNRDHERENARNIEAEIVRLRGEAEKEQDPDKMGSLLAQIRVAGHSLNAKQAQIDLLNSKIRDCSLLAPISGTVLEPEQPDELLGFFVREGEPLCRIGSIARVRVKIAVPAERVRDIETGLEVQIRLRPLVSDEPMLGNISTIGGQSVTHKNANVYIADVIVDNVLLAVSGDEGPQYLLKPGMTGKAKIIRSDKSTYLAIYGGMLVRKMKYWLF